MSFPALFASPDFVLGGLCILLSLTTGVLFLTLRAERRGRRPLADPRHAQLLAHVHDAIVSTDLDGRILTWNAGAERLFGYSAAAVVGRSIRLLEYGRESGVLEQQMTVAVLASGAHEIVDRFRHESGYAIVAAVRLAVLKDDKGAPVGIVSCSHDVTRKHEQEEAFQLRARVLESMAEGVCLTDDQGVIVHTNPACEKIFDRHGRGLVGRQVQSLVNDDAPELMLENVARCLTNDGAWTGEINSTKPDGAAVVLQSQVSELSLADGPFWVWVFQDVTQRKRDLADLAEREQRFRTMADSAPVIVWLSDAAGRCLYVNGEWTRLTGLSAEESLGEGWRRAVVDDIEPERLRRFAERMHRRELLEAEFHLRSASGEQRWMLLRGVPRYDGDGRFVGYVGSGVDTTALKEAEQQRREMLRRDENRRKLEGLGVVAGGIAHDFNNLLVSMLGYAELARDSAEEGSAARENIEQFQAAAQRAEDLTNQILSFSGKRRMRLELLRLGESAQETVEIIRPSLSPEAEVVLELADESTVEADPGQLGQVVMNLVINASDALRGRGRVVVRVGRCMLDRERLDAAIGGAALEPGECACLQVSDDGCGIDEETMARIFDPFFTTKYTGKGLGLAASLGVIQAHGGAIEVESEVGRGSTFRVLFPLAEPAAVPAPGEEEAAQPGTETILLVDDDNGVLEASRRLLEKYGYGVYTAVDRLGGIGQLADDPDGIDLVMLDIVMPGMSVAEAIERLREVRPDIPIVLWSGFHDGDIGSVVNGQEVSGFLQKPFAASTLTGTIRSALGALSGRRAGTGA